MSVVSHDQDIEVRQPLVVIIDDEDQSSFAELIRDEGAEAIAVAPNDLDEQLLTRATAVVLDQYLDDWPEREQLQLPPTLYVSDGISLASVLRSRVERSGSRRSSIPQPIAFVLRTGELESLGAGMPKAAREHLLAAQYNLEWVFSKGFDPSYEGSSPAQRIAALARAASELPTHWSADTDDPGLGWLQLPDAPWAEDARWQIEQCRPPQHIVAEKTAGMAWFRWFLHRILPFPTFLFDSVHLAVVLGISTESLNEVLNSGSPLAERLDELRYRGALSSFLGRRWWRAGVSSMAEEFLDKGREIGLDRLEAVAAGAAQLHGDELEGLDIEDPVIGIDADYNALAYPLSAASSLRLQPDNWPPYADDAWAAQDSLLSEDADPELRALVVSIDRWRIHR